MQLFCAIPVTIVFIYLYLLCNDDFFVLSLYDDEINLPTHLDQFLDHDPPGTTKPFSYIVITQLLLPCWVKAQPKAPQWCFFRGGCFSSLLYVISVLKLSMLQGSIMFWLTICHACTNLSFCRGSSHVCWVVAPMQLTFLLFRICQLLHIFGFLGLIPYLLFNFSVTILFSFHSP